jgi:hypothetical protein
LAANSPEPEVYQAHIDRIACWLEAPAELPIRLVDLLVTGKHASLEMYERMVEAALASRNYLPNARRFHFLDRTVSNASWLMIELGAPAREALLCAYDEAPRGSKERHWFLITLSRMGDRELEPFFDALQEGDFDVGEMAATANGFRWAFEVRCAEKEIHQHGVEEIHRALTHEREGWRYAAVTALQMADDERAIEALQGLLDDQAESVRNNARFTIGLIARRLSKQSGAPSAGG